MIWVGATGIPKVKIHVFVWIIFPFFFIVIFVASVTPASLISLITSSLVLPFSSALLTTPLEMLRPLCGVILTGKSHNLFSLRRVFEYCSLVTFIKIVLLLICFFTLSASIFRFFRSLKILKILTLVISLDSSVGEITKYLGYISGPLLKSCSLI